MSAVVDMSTVTHFLHYRLCKPKWASFFSFSMKMRFRVTSMGACVIRFFGSGWLNVVFIVSIL